MNASTSSDQGRPNWTGLTRNFLISGNLMKLLQQINGFQWEKLDVVKLRGKEVEVELFSVSDAHTQLNKNTG